MPEKPDQQLLWAIRVLREVDAGTKRKQSDVNQACRILEVAER